MTAHMASVLGRGTRGSRWLLVTSFAALVGAACQRGERSDSASDTTHAAHAAGDTAAACPAGNGGITLPAGFCATVFADSVGHARHMAVAPNGVVYVNTWSGRY